jgi:hypothetical protein
MRKDEWDKRGDEEDKERSAGRIRAGSLWDGKKNETDSRELS